MAAAAIASGQPVWGNTDVPGEDGEQIEEGCAPGALTLPATCAGGCFGRGEPNPPVFLECSNDDEIFHNR